MKVLTFIYSLILLLVSCHPEKGKELSSLLNVPTDTVELTTNGEKFTVDFTLGASILQLKNHEFAFLKDEFEKLKTKEDLMNFYKVQRPIFLPGYSSRWPDQRECIFVKVEYMLAQECFGQRCDSKFRMEVLQLVVDHQKGKLDDIKNRYSSPMGTLKTGVFLMGVILVKERKSSAKFIDAVNLQRALLYLSDDTYYCEDLNNLIIESSEKFLASN